MTAETAALLASMADWGAEFERTFSNHAPMALTALAGIGGSPEAVARFFAYYRYYKKLQPFGAPTQPLDGDTRESALGERSREPDLRAFFQGETARLGVEGVLRAYLPRLAPGVAASAFHGLMRLAYALLRGSAEDVDIALGYWAATYLPLRPATGAAPLTHDPAEVLARAMQIAPLHDLPLQPCCG